MMMKTALAVLMLTSCVAPVAQQADTNSSRPYIRGAITSITERGIMVEENPAKASGSNKALVRLTADTQIVSADGRTLGKSDLRVGQTVSAWTTGAVMESFPVQVTGTRVVVGSLAAGDSMP